MKHCKLTIYHICHKRCSISGYKRSAYLGLPNRLPKQHIRSPVIGQPVLFTGCITQIMDTLMDTLQ